MCKDASQLGICHTLQLEAERHMLPKSHCQHQPMNTLTNPTQSALKSHSKPQPGHLLSTAAGGSASPKMTP
jgi:hypothetical protein